MISFECDYNNGAHPQVLRLLLETNNEQSLTYGFDKWSESAKERIRSACECPDAQIYFLSGGTQTNMTVIDGCLEHYEAVLTASTGHINIHEAGAPEFTGHKVISLPAHDGKMQVSDLQHYMDWFEHDESRDHLAQPGMVYITFPTEYGTLYTAQELTEIYAECQKRGLKLFIDGARMGYGLAASDDVTLPFLAHHCDVFYIGGTKVGAFCGEAVVFPRGNAPKALFTIIKQHGALMAKGRLIGIQFDALFTDGLYLDISRHAIDMARRMREFFTDKGLRFAIDSPTNQQFVILPLEVMHRLEQQVLFTHWEPTSDGQMVCRFVTSWATTDDDLQVLERIFNEIMA